LNGGCALNENPKIKGWNESKESSLVEQKNLEGVRSTSYLLIERRNEIQDSHRTSVKKNNHQYD